MLWFIVGVLAGLLFNELTLYLLDLYLDRKVASEANRRKKPPYMGN